MAKTVLIIDDEKDIVELLAEEFEDNGFEVEQAFSVSGAIEILNQKNFDIVLSDFRMPDGTGLELLERVKSETNTTRFFFISGQADILPQEASELGAEMFFYKPFDIDELVQSIVKITK